MSQIGIEPSKGNCSQSIQDFTKIGGDLLSLSMDSSLKFVRAVLDMLTPSLAGMNLPCIQPVCDIPETECPPKCVCKIHWEVCKGENRKHAIRITNTAKKVIDFKLSATPFEGLAGSSNLITLQPDRLVLKPGESGVSMAGITVPEAAPSGSYRAKILVRGQYEQHVRVDLTVKDVRHCICDIRQGEIPVRIRAHRWYDHFQCVEPCFEPIRRDTPTRPVAEATAVEKES